MITNSIKVSAECDEIPRRATQGSAGYDLCAYEQEGGWHEIRPGEASRFKTGVSIEIPDGHCGLLFVRSSLGARGLVNATGVSVIDSDYRGDVIIVLRNIGGEDQVIRRGDRIAQIVIVPCLMTEMVQSKLGKTQRGERGFGSTGR